MKLTKAIAGVTDYLDQWLEFQRDMRHHPGIQVAIRLGGELLYSKAFGVSNVETGEPLATSHLFHVASHSKTFTATAIMQLWEKGALRLDDSVGHWIPEMVGTPAGEYTVRELLGHNTGIIRDGEDATWWVLKKDFPARDELLKTASGDGIFGANEHFKYSNIGYSLLGLIVEAAAGEPYNEYVVTHITEPLGLKNTGPEVPEDRVADLAAGHTLLFSGEDTRRVIPHVGTFAESAATGFYSTAEEITKYMAAHTFGREELVNDATKRLMQRKESEANDEGTEWYGLGFQMTKVNGRMLIGHSGGWPGHITRTWLDPKTGLCVSVLANCLGAWSISWATSIIKMIDYVEGLDSKPELPKDVDIERFVGRYAGMWGIVDVANLGGHLHEMDPWAMDFQTGAGELTVVDATTLAPKAEAGYGAQGENYVYGFAKDGSVQHVWQGGEQFLPIADYVATRNF